jgi:hypothetical protein
MRDFAAPTSNWPCSAIVCLREGRLGGHSGVPIPSDKEVLARLGTSTVIFPHHGRDADVVGSDGASRGGGGVTLCRRGLKFLFSHLANYDRKIHVLPKHEQD